MKWYKYIWMVVLLMGYWQGAAGQIDIVIEASNNYLCEDDGTNINESIELDDIASTLPNGNLSYRWEWKPDDATEFEDVPDFVSLFSGIATEDLTILKTGSYSSAVFRLVVTVDVPEPGEDIDYESNEIEVFKVSRPVTPTLLETDEEISICSGQTVDLAATANPLQDHEEIVWYRGDPDNSGQRLNDNPATISTAATYFVRVEGCENSSTRQVVVEVGVAPTAPEGITVEFGVNSIAGVVCEGTDLDLIANPAAGDVSNADYIWATDEAFTNIISDPGNAGELDIIANESTTYFVKRNGCGETGSISRTITVIQPEIENFPAEVCPGEMFTLTGQEITLAPSVPASLEYRWSVDGSNIDGREITTSIANPGMVDIGFVVSIRDDDDADADYFSSCPAVTETIDVKPNPILGISNQPEGNDFCQNEAISFTALGPTGTYSWTFGDGTTMQGNTVNHTFENDGDFSVSLSLSGSGCNADDASKTVSIQELPNVELAEDKNCVQVDNPSTFEVNNSDLPGTYSWDFGENATPPMEFGGGPVEVTFDSLGNEMATLTYIEGACTVILSDDFPVQAQCGDVPCELANFTIPNILSPNGDDFNETWQIPEGIPNATETPVRVYSRSGACVFGCDGQKTIPDAKNWSGTECPSGSYYYVFECPNGQKLKGALTIIR